jgi:hypothetical protein
MSVRFMSIEGNSAIDILGFKSVRKYHCLKEKYERRKIGERAYNGHELIKLQILFTGMLNICNQKKDI